MEFWNPEILRYASDKLMVLKAWFNQQDPRTEILYAVLCHKRTGNFSKYTYKKRGRTANKADTLKKDRAIASKLAFYS
jgi:hypothetical protein